MAEKRRADGEGSVYERDGYWWALVSYSDPVTGKRLRRSARRTTQKAAVQALTELQDRKRAGQPLRDASVTLRSWSRQWVTTGLAASPRRQTTQGTYATLLRTTVLPHLGEQRLDRITPSVVEAWLLRIEAQGLSASTRRQALTVLRACLDTAVRDGLLATNPAAKVTRPTAERVEAHHYSREQVETILDHVAGHRHERLVRLLLGTGLRRGEALALRWRDVHPERQELHVRGTLVRTSAGLVTNPPKTANGRRTVPLSPAVALVLREQRKAQIEDRLAAGEAWVETGLVFTTEGGTPLDPRNTSRWFSDAATAAGVGGSLHSLRHTALSGMALAGVPLHVVSRIAGHESISTTVDLYGHVTEDAARDAVSRAAERFGL